MAGNVSRPRIGRLAAIGVAALMTWPVHGEPTVSNFPQAPQPTAEPPAARPDATQRRTPARRPSVPSAPQIVRAFPPPAGELRFRRGEVVVETVGGVSSTALAAILRRHRLVEAEAASLALLGEQLRRWRAGDARDAAGLTRELANEPLIAGVQPNYVYTPQDSASASPAGAAAAQYALAKLRVDVARAIATGDKVRVAVIDTGVDDGHPDLSGAIEMRVDTIGGASAAGDHGTSIAGAIAGRGEIEGVAPKSRILAARAFESTATGFEGTTFSIARGVDWAVENHARIVNMSFAGPADPLMRRALAAADRKGVALVAAAGNAGSTSPPLYPGADEGVIAVTATDLDDKLYAQANRGGYIAVAAPGVDVLLPTANGGYGLETGTSVAAALVSGVAALVLERRPDLTPQALRKVLVGTAKPISAASRADGFGAGLVDAARAVAQ
jgi:subtilisin family serine protease